MTLLINAERFRQDFETLSQFGATGDGGVHRPCWSEPHLAAQRWWLGRAAEAGLQTRTDSAGNVSSILQSPILNSPTLLLGSHTDSVPNGGRFDGALGVLAALEVARTIKESGMSLPVNLEVIDFADEEGTLVGLLGSRALAGSLTAEELRTPRGGREALEAGMARAGVTEAGLLSARRPTKGRVGEARPTSGQSQPTARFSQRANARRDPATLAGYLELHIEQGPTLARRAIPIGVVQSIVGIRSFALTYRGQANHAGTTPMDQRADAAIGAAAFTLTAREMVLREFSGCVVNVGQMRFSPGAYNIIPGAADLALEFRGPEAQQLDTLQAALLGLAQLIAQQYGLTLTAEPFSECAPTPMSSRAIQAVTTSADSLALTHVPLHSGAGHDAMSLAHLCDVGMVFVPSRGGISHSPLEFTEFADCVNGANVLLRAALAMADVNREA